MQGTSNCRVCECGHDTHFHANKKLVKTKETLEEVLQDVKVKFDRATTQQASLTNSITTFQADTKALRDALQDKENTIRECCRQLQTICKEYNFVAAMTANIWMMEADARTITSVEGRQEADAMIRRIKTLVNNLTAGVRKY